MSATLESSKKNEADKSAIAKSGQAARPPEKKAGQGSLKIAIIIGFFIICILMIALTLYNLDNDIKSVAKNNGLLEDKIALIEKDSESAGENLKTSAGALKDMSAALASLEKKIASNEENAAKFLPEIKNIEASIEGLQNKYDSIAARVAETEKNIAALVAENIAKQQKKR